MRYRIIQWDGEGKTLFYVMDKAAPEENQPCTMGCFGNREDAEEAARCLNMAGVVIT